MPPPSIHTVAFRFVCSANAAPQVRDPMRRYTDLWRFVDGSLSSLADDRNGASVKWKRRGVAAPFLSRRSSREKIAHRLPVLLLGFGNALVGKRTEVRVDALSDAIVPQNGCLCSVLSDLEHVGQGRVGQRQGGGVRNGSRHVGNGVVHDAIDFIGGIAVRGAVRGFDASTLVDGNIHDRRRPSSCWRPSPW